MPYRPCGSRNHRRFRLHTEQNAPHHLYRRAESRQTRPLREARRKNLRGSSHHAAGSARNGSHAQHRRCKPLQHCRKRNKKLIDAGELGEVYHVHVSFRAHRSIPGLGGAFTTKEIAGGGALIDWGVHYLDIVMYCMGDPAPLTVSGKAFSKLGVDMKNYVYESMWAENTKNLDGTYDVDDSVTAFVRTEGPTITLNGAWAQNIGLERDLHRLPSAQRREFVSSTAEISRFTAQRTAELIEYKPEYESTPMFQNEVNAFAPAVFRQVRSSSSHIDKNILTSKLMQGILRLQRPRRRS